MSAKQFNAPLKEQLVDSSGRVKSNVWWKWFNIITAKIKGKVDGSGTAGIMTKWEDADTITDSSMTEAYLRGKIGDFDDMDPTYDSNGFLIERLWKRDTVIRVIETLTYNPYGNIAIQVFSGDITETRTYTYTLTFFDYGYDYVLTDLAVT